MITSDVPTAYVIGSARASSSAGTTRKPPPTPRKPVSRPTAVAVTSTFRARGQLQPKVGLKVMIGSSRLGRSPASGLVGSPWPSRRQAIRAPTSSISAAKQASSTSSLTSAAPVAPAAAPPIATTPKTTPRPSSTLPWRCAETAPASDVTPTTTSEPVVACVADWSSR